MVTKNLKTKEIFYNFFAISALNQQDSEEQEPKSWVGCSFFDAWVEDHNTSEKNLIHGHKICKFPDTFTLAGYLIGD